MNQTIKIKDPLFVLRKISKDYSNDLFSDVNLTVNHNDRIAIVGPNGIGKTTLLKIIIELEESDDGNIVKNKNLKIGYLPQETHWKSLENTVEKEICSTNMIEGDPSNPYRSKGLIEHFLKYFGLAEEVWQRKVKTLSGGERTKLALAKVFASEPNLLILDEPTNHLDLETIERLEGFLLKWKGAIICVSHDRYFLDKLFNKTFELNKEGLEKYFCPYSEYLLEKEKHRERQERGYKQQQKYLDKQQVFIDRFRYKATKAKGVQSRIKQLKKLSKKEKPETVKDIRMNFGAVKKTCTRVLQINDLIIANKELPLFKICDTIEIEWSNKIGIIGRNGVGKSSLLKTILSEIGTGETKIKIGQGVKIGYYAQAHEELDPEKNILEEVLSKTSVNGEKIRNVLGSLLFTQDDIMKKISKLSGGERARVALAELILQKSNFLLLDEPTNHLDMQSKEIISNVLKEFSGTILLISHDRYILNKICNFIWEIKDAKLEKYLGNYEDYRYHLGF